MQRCPPGGANTPHLLGAAGPVPDREDKPQALSRDALGGVVGAGFLEEVGINGQGWEGEEDRCPGLQRGAEVEGGGPMGKLSQVSVRVQDVYLP